MIGRDEAIGTLKRLLGAHRFVSIVGAGGMGKTTVAVALAYQLRDEFPDAVHFVDLVQSKKSRRTFRRQRNDGNSAFRRAACGHPALDRYLQKQAPHDAEKLVAAPFVLTEPPSATVLGYYTLSAAHIDAGRAGAAVPANENRRSVRLDRELRGPVQVQTLSATTHRSVVRSTAALRQVAAFLKEDR